MGMESASPDTVIASRDSLGLTVQEFDFVKLLDGKQLIKQETKGSEDSYFSPRNLILTSLQETGFIEYMDLGTWHLAFYNDGKKMEQVFVLTTAIGNEQRAKQFK
ncbi:Teneurin-1 [Acipenser ruthenus]|uniref:Teneurin-1 n=1 Tax=Acipenser ruthenus TaxID=7906 RepID=A0A444UQY9_ACIRT|nr:Teneurin-1 [Acipenser ruthenus]